MKISLIFMRNILFLFHDFKLYYLNHIIKQKTGGIFMLETFDITNNFNLRLDMDEEKLTIKISTETPDSAENEFIFFDVANGKFESCIEYLNGKTAARQKQLSQHTIYFNTLSALGNFQKRCITEKQKRFIFEKFLKLIYLFTNIPYETLCERYRYNLSCFSLKELYRLTMIPFEPGVWTVVCNRIFEIRNIGFTYDRKDPDIFEKLCHAMKIPDTEKIREFFNECPKTLLTYLNLRDCGFTDTNLYYRVFENFNFSNFIDGTEMRYLSVFIRCSIKECGEKATIDNLLKETICLNEKSLAIELFVSYFDDISDDLKKNILQEGFNSFNFEALLDIMRNFEKVEL